MDSKTKNLSKKTLTKILDCLRVKAEIQEEKTPKDEPLTLKIQGEDLGFLIGYHGETLSSLEFLLKLIIYTQKHVWPSLVIEVGDYRKRRQESIQAIAQRAAERAIFLKEPVALAPMKAYERRIVHVVLKDHARVTTESVGEGIERKVVVYPKEKD